ACDLARMAGFDASGVICEIMNDDGSMARRPELEVFAEQHGIKIGTIADLIHYRMIHERTIERVSEQPLDTELGQFNLVTYRDRTCDLASMAGLDAIGVIFKIMNDDGSMARRPELEVFAEQHGIKIGTIADLIHYRMIHERTIERVSEQPLDTELGQFNLVTY